MQEHKLKRLNIELSAACNYACVSCPNTYFSREKGHMSQKLFVKIFEEVGNSLGKVFLWNYGEPLLNPRLPEMLESIRAYSAVKSISTTGYMLENFRDLSFMNALDEIIISINGLTQEVYEFHQEEGDLEKVKRGIKLLRNARDRGKNSLILQVVVNRANIDVLDKFNKFALEYGFDEIIFKSFNVMDNKRETFRKFVPTRTKYARYNAKGTTLPINPQKNAPCLEWMVINWNGDVNPCCWDYEGKYIMGNVEKQGVYGVWNSLKMVEHRKKISDKNFLDICIDCTNSKIIEQRKVK